ncbi:FAD-dependent monooxygenase [Streptomyces tricolor]|nr:FAD-dependent monooxygenase [Streptomyces tricolor]
MRSASSLQTDVLVVGYGPVGSVLSVLLAQRGWRVTVLERRRRAPHTAPGDEFRRGDRPAAGRYGHRRGAGPDHRAGHRLPVADRGREDPAGHRVHHRGPVRLARRQHHAPARAGGAARGPRSPAAGHHGTAGPPGRGHRPTARPG